MIKRSDFPILKRKINGRPLVYFDNASTVQKPGAVIKSLVDYYERHNANVHRGMSPLAAEVTRLYEESRQTVAAFIGAAPAEIIFTRGTTESINLVARTWGDRELRAGDIVILSLAEHHANIIPWLQLRDRIGIRLEYIPLHADGTWNMAAAKKLLDHKRAKLLAVSQVSNVLGIINPLAELLKLARCRGLVTLVDAAQSIAHLQINVQELACDFLVFSGHKIGGPTGIGVLFGRREILAALPPFLGGGEMIMEVTTKSFSVKEAPFRFEAGTPNIAGAIGLGAACRYLNKLDNRIIRARERELTAYFLKKIRTLRFIKILGTAKGKVPIFSLVIKNMHAHDAADLLGQEGIILRSGHHCAQPLHDFFQVPASLRASLSFYNTFQEIDFFVARLRELYQAFAIKPVKAFKKRAGF